MIESVKNGKNDKKSVSQVGVPTGINAVIIANKSGNHNILIPNTNIHAINVANPIGFTLTSKWLCCSP